MNCPASRSRTACPRTTRRTTLDLDIYGTLNFTNNFGVQGGYRSFDLGYTVKDNNITTDAGSFVLKGLYVGAVARF